MTASQVHSQTPTYCNNNNTRQAGNNAFINRDSYGTPHSLGSHTFKTKQ